MHQSVCRVSFKSYTYPHKYGKNRTKLYSAGVLTCHTDLCSTKCEAIQGLLWHLKSHISEGKTVMYMPFQTMCQKKITVKSTFTSLVSRKRKDCSGESLVDSANLSSTSECDEECCDLRIPVSPVMKIWEK